jgi:MFS family permease
LFYSFGVFFKPMAEEFGTSRANTSAVFSITACIYNLLGIVSGHLSDRFGPRPVVIAGAIAMGIGLITTAFIDRLWMGYITYGLGVGIGVACIYVPMLAVVSGWFVKRRNMALGIAVSGVGCGTLVMAPLAAALIEHYGWRESYAIMGVAGALILLGCALFTEAPPVPMVTGELDLARAARTPNFLMLYAAWLVLSVAVYVPFVYLPEFAHSQGASQVSSAALVGIIGAASIFGRLGLGPIADRAGTITAYKASTLLLALGFGLWFVPHSYAALVLFAIVMGAAYGGMVAMSPSVVAELFGLRGLGAMLGALSTSSSLSALAGPLIAGWVIDRTGSFLWSAALGGASALIGFIILIPLGPAHMVESTLTAANPAEEG